jgi:hypothetical protein
MPVRFFNYMCKIDTRMEYRESATDLKKREILEDFFLNFTVKNQGV